MCEKLAFAVTKKAQKIDTIPYKCTSVSKNNKKKKKEKNTKGIT